MDDCRVACADTGCEYGAAVIIICGLWAGTMLGCCRPVEAAAAAAAEWDDGAARLAEMVVAGSLAPVGAARPVDVGCSCGLRHWLCM